MSNGNILFVEYYNSLLGEFLRIQGSKDFSYDVVSKKEKVLGRLRDRKYRALILENLDDEGVEILRKSQAKGVTAIVLASQDLPEMFIEEAKKLGATVIDVPVGKENWKEVASKYNSEIEKI